MWYIHLCLTDYTFSSLGKRDLRHANSSLGMSCVTSHLLVSNPIDLPRPPHVSRRSSPLLRVAQAWGFSALLHPHHRRCPASARGLRQAPLSITTPRWNTGEKCSGWDISLIGSLRIRMILSCTTVERTFQGYSVRTINLLKHTSSLITCEKKTEKKRRVCCSNEKS